MLECVLFVDVHHVSNALTDAVGVRFTYWNKDYKIGVWVLLPAGKIARTKQLSDDVCEDSIIELGMTRNTCLFAASEEYP